MEKLIFIAVFTLLIFAIFRSVKRSRIKNREKLIDTYTFPSPPTLEQHTKQSRTALLA